MTVITQFSSPKELSVVLAGNYQKQIENYFGDPKAALEFLSNVIAAAQRNPKLLDCTPVSVINSFITMAQLKLMPSGVSGEAYVIPYQNGQKLEAQFQLGYQGIVTLLYRAGNKSVAAELVRKNDKFTLVNGKINHEVDPLKSAKERGEVIGAYAIITTAAGGTVEKFMHNDDIKLHAEKFSKSYSGKFSPWTGGNDPEGWMPRKTVLKQAAKLAPRNEMLNLAIAEDNKDSTISDRLEAAKKESAGAAMGALLKPTNANEKNLKAPQSEDDQTGPDSNEPVIERK